VVGSAGPGEPRGQSREGLEARCFSLASKACSPSSLLLGASLAGAWPSPAARKLSDLYLSRRKVRLSSLYFSMRSRQRGSSRSRPRFLLSDCIERSAQGPDWELGLLLPTFGVELCCWGVSGLLWACCSSMLPPPPTPPTPPTPTPPPTPTLVILLNLASSRERLSAALVARA
jgi:hypothetical protein